LLALHIDKEVFLPTPGKVFDVLIHDLLPSETFRLSIVSSLKNIGYGFLIGLVFGLLLAILASISYLIEIFLWLPIKIIKTVPVASFVILSLLWIDSKDLAVFIPAIIVLPTIYINTLTGIKETNSKLLDMAKIFKIPFSKRIFSIYVPSTLPYFLSACSLAIGMAWKSGVAAEIIGLAKNTIGNELYKSKLYFMTAEVFAWTIVIILLSIICELFIKTIIKIFNTNN
jgi:NitT/TauT family transport system permease protein